MSFQIKLTDPEPLFNKRIITEFLREINKHFRMKLTPLKKAIAPEIAEAVYQSKEIQSILFGTLSAELGFVSPGSIVKEIYNAVKRSVHIDFKSFKYDGKQISGNLQVLAIHDDFSDLIADIPTASYKSNGHDIDWLNWLLFEGDDIIIADYEIVYGVYSPQRSRSGRAIMEEGNHGYHIPTKFSGTQFDNFITRSIDKKCEQRIRAIMEKVLK